MMKLIVALRNFANLRINQKCITFQKMSKNYLNQVMFQYFRFCLIFFPSTQSSAQKKKGRKNS